MSHEKSNSGILEAVLQLAEQSSQSIEAVQRVKSLAEEGLIQEPDDSALTCIKTSTDALMKLLSVAPERAGADEGEGLKKGFVEAMHALDTALEKMLELSKSADLDLQELQEEPLPQWLAAKKASEHYKLQFSALKAMMYVMRNALESYDKYLENSRRRLGTGGTVTVGAQQEEEMKADVVTAVPTVAEAAGNKLATDESILMSADEGAGACTAQGEMPSAEVTADVGTAMGKMHTATGKLSMKDAAGTGGPPSATGGVIEQEAPRRYSDDETIGAVEDASRDFSNGSSDAAQTGRGQRCPFGDDLCDRGENCQKCHRCQRKSSTRQQRDVDKRRQERHRKAREDYGQDCYETLSTIDDCRRFMLSSSEDLKKLVKEAFAAQDAQRIDEVKELARQLQAVMATMGLEET